AVLVDVAEVRAHRDDDAGEPALARHVAEAAVAVVPVEPLHLGAGRAVAVPPGHLGGARARRPVAGGVEVEPAVVVEVEEEAGEALDRRGDAELLGDVDELAAPLIVVEAVLPPEIGEVEVGQAIAVVVAERRALAPAIVADAGRARDLLEGRVATIPEEPAGVVLAAAGALAVVSEEDVE